MIVADMNSSETAGVDDNVNWGSIAPVTVLTRALRCYVSATDLLRPSIKLANLINPEESMIRLRKT